jgi:sulfane dehydrogenase subunit SoxC
MVDNKAMHSGAESASAEDFAAGNGLMHRRALLGSAVGLAAAAAGGLLQARTALAQSEAPAAPDARPWSRAPGTTFSGYGQPSSFENAVHRVVTEAYPTIVRGTGASLTPLEKLQGTITPSGLHFERHHSGIPAIDPTRHKLLLHGLVKRPLTFTIDALHRYPQVTRIHYVECSGNSRPLLAPAPLQRTCGELHGLLSCTEWTGVPVAALLEEAGVDANAAWVLAEGADAASMVRSIPLEKLLGDALLVLYQNGEAIRPEQGYPVRLLLPGFEGNANVKWLQRLEVLAAPAMARDETAKYTDPMPDGPAHMFTLKTGVKSVITHPSGAMQLPGPGFYEISGLAWTGEGRIRKVEVSADSGATWAEAALVGAEHPHAVVRFRSPWQWNGGPAVLKSRATDEQGRVQETRDQWIARNSVPHYYHYNGIQAWEVLADGRVRNAYL